jgi:hypothetical protein
VQTVALIQHHHGYYTLDKESAAAAAAVGSGISIKSAEAMHVHLLCSMAGH